MTLTPEQQQMVKAAIGNSRDFPKFTVDPRVNHVVDQIVLGDVPDWDDLPEEERALYHEEIEAAEETDR